MHELITTGWKKKIHHLRMEIALLGWKSNTWTISG